MERIKTFLSQKRYGFYVTICASLLAIVTACVYAGLYHDYLSMMSWTAFILLLATALVSVAMTLWKYTAPFAPIPVAVGALAGLLLYVDAMYNYVAVVLVGIDLAGFSASFIVTTVFVALTFVVAVANIFFGQVKENKEEVKEDLAHE